MCFQELPSPESGVIVKTAKDGNAEGLIYGGGGKEGLFIKEVVPESPASKNLKLKEGDQVLSATVYFDNVPYEDAIQILEHAQAYRMKLCLKRKPEIIKTEPAMETELIPVTSFWSDCLFKPFAMGNQEKPKDVEMLAFHESPSKFKLPSFKFPKFGVALSNARPEIDFSRSNKDAEIKLPEGEAEVDLPNVELKESSDKVDVKVPEIKAQMSSVKGSPSKFKLPTFKFPTFGIGTPDAHAEKPDGKDMEVGGQITGEFDVNPEMASVSILGESELCEEERKVKMAEVGMSLPKLKGPEMNISMSKKDAEVKLKEAEETSAKVEIKEIEDTKGSLKESPSKFKFPTFKFPKFGVALPSVSTEVPSVDKDVEVEVKVPELPDIDVNLGITEVLVQEAQKPENEIKPLQQEGELDNQEEIKLQVKEVQLKTEVKSPDIDAQIGSVKGSPSKLKLPTFKFPKFGIATPNVSAEVQGAYKYGKSDNEEMNMPKNVTEGDIAVQSIDIKRSSIDLKTSEPKSDGKGSKFKVPKFGLSLPKVQGPKIDLTVSHKDVKVNLPDVEAKDDLQEIPDIDVHLGKAEVIIPEAKIEIQKPQVKLKPLKSHGKIDGQGGSMSIKDAHIKIPEAEAEVSLSDVELKGPTAKMEVTAPEIGVQSESLKGSPSKFKIPTFKLPKFGMGTPTVSAEVPDIEEDINVETKIAEVPGIDAQLGTDVTITETREEIQKPDVEIKPLQPEVELGGQSSKLKKSRFSLPKISRSKPSVKATEVDVSLCDVTAALPDTDTQLEGEVDMTHPEQEAGVDGQEIKFKMPKIGVTMEEVKGPQIDISLSKNDGELTKQDVTAEVKPTKAPSAETEMTPKIKVVTKKKEGSPSKFKMPTFKLPKFGDGSPKSTAEIPTEINEADINNPEEVLAIEIAASSIAKKGIDDTIPEVKVDVQIPGAEKEQASSPLRFKMPTFTLPKFGGAATSVNVEIPDVEQEIKVNIDPDIVPEGNVEVITPEATVKTPESDVQIQEQSKFKMPKFGISVPKGPDIDINLSKKDTDVTVPKAEIEARVPELALEPSEGSARIDEKGSKFKMPRFGITMPKVKSTEIDLSKKDTDVTIPEVKAEVQLTEVKQPTAKVEIGKASKLEGSPSKLKMPTITLPKFASTKVSMQISDVNSDVKIDSAKVDESEVEPTVGIVDAEGPSVELKTKEGEIEGSESRFRMPRFGISVPKVKSPEIDLGMTSKTTDPLPGVDIKESETSGLVQDASTRQKHQCDEAGENRDLETLNSLLIGTENVSFKNYINCLTYLNCKKKNN
uniref:PDZ domain-containing protein n=1 Tax=Cynoglossus semilaevis TaxID=244447 RepID=A0A3P8W306_CYNSE